MPELPALATSGGRHKEGVIVPSSNFRCSNNTSRLQTLGYSHMRGCSYPNTSTLGERRRGTNKVQDSFAALRRILGYSIMRYVMHVFGLYC